MKNNFKKSDIRKFLNEAHSMTPEMYRCDCSDCPVCDEQEAMGYQYEEPDDDLRLDLDMQDSAPMSEMPPSDHYYDGGHPGESDGGPMLQPDGSISPEELYHHFDVDGDGRVDMKDYAEHVDYHCEHPELLEDYLELKDYRRDDVHCHDSYSKSCDYLMVDKNVALEMIQKLMDSCGATCPTSTASALADVLELLKSKNLIA